MGPTRARAVDGEWMMPISVVMIETVEGVSRANEILSVPGVDAVFVGPNDLAVSAGLESGYEGRNPEHRRLIESVADAARAQGVTPGIMCGTPEVALHWRKAGFLMLALQSDTRLLTAATEEIAARSKELLHQ